MVKIIPISSFGMKYGFEYTEKYFRKIFINSEKIVIEESDRWSNDSWFKDQDKRKFIQNDGMKIINKENGRRKKYRWEFVHIKSITGD